MSTTETSTSTAVISKHPQPPEVKSPTMGVWTAYTEILRPRRLRSLLSITLLTISGVLEGLALVTLIPILNSLNQGDGTKTSSSVVASAIAHFSLSEREAFLASVLLFLTLAISSAAFRLLSETSLIWLRTQIEEDLQMSMTESLLKMQWSRYINLRVGDLTKSILSEGLKVSSGTQLFLEGIGTCFVALAFLSLSLVIAPIPTIYTTVFGIFGILLYRIVSKRSRRHSSALSSIQGNIGERMSEIFNNLKFFRAGGATALILNRASEAFKEFSRALFWAFEYGYIMRCLFESAAAVFVASFLLVNVFYFQEPLPSLLVFLALFYRLAPRLLKIQESFFHARTCLSWYISYRARLSYTESYPDNTNGSAAPSFKHSFTVNNVSFCYPEVSIPALRNISFSFSQGECIAVVGASGSGKSTLLDLVLKLLDPTEGEIRIDDVELSTIDKELWRHKIGLVTQESPVFFGSVLSNIAYGDPSPDCSRAEAAARMAHAWEFIERLPEKLESLIGEKGGNLSGGQRQRLAIARALYREPSLLILDEATSALDSESERIVQKALEELRGSVAMLVVAHRLQTVKYADRILVLDKGRIVESGTWNELMSSSDGALRKLAKAQEVALAEGW